MKKPHFPRTERTQSISRWQSSLRSCVMMSSFDNLLRIVYVAKVSLAAARPGDSMKRLKPTCLLCLFALLGSLTIPCQAIDPEPDYWTLIFPTHHPKNAQFNGNSGAFPNLLPGEIRAAYHAMGPRPRWCGYSV